MNKYDIVRVFGPLYFFNKNASAVMKGIITNADWSS